MVIAMAMGQWDNGNGAMGQRRRQLQLQLQWHWGRSNGNGNGARGMGPLRLIMWVCGGPWGAGVVDVLYFVYSVFLFEKVSEWQKEVRIKE
jgi:hypothetical protein